MQQLRELARLAAAGLVEGLVGAALEATLAVPVGLPVPNQDDRRRHAGYPSRPWISDSSGKKCLVTGSTGGIGLEVVRQLVTEGALVVTCGRRGAPGVGEARARRRATWRATASPSASSPKPSLRSAGSTSS